MSRVLWFGGDPASPPPPLCCEAMTAAATHECDQHDSPFDCADALVVYNDALREHGLVIHDGGASYLLIRHCPWCGAALPESLRDAWIERLDALGLEPFGDLPPEMESAAWREGLSP